MSVGDGTQLYCGDCLDVLRDWQGEQVTAVVCDPPYGLEFMGKEWDKPHKARIRERVDKRTNPGNGKSTTRTPESYTAGKAAQAWHQQWAEAVLRVLKPGGMLLAFGGTRTFHRLTCALEDAGFEIRDTLMWVYGSGFPKSCSISKQLDKAAGAEREVVTQKEIVPADLFDEETEHEVVKNLEAPATAKKGTFNCSFDESRAVITAPATEAAKLWDGYGTALKPSWEPCILAMKPLAGTFAQNAQRHGVAGINVDGCRITMHGTDNIHGKNPHTSGGIVDGQVYGKGKPTTYQVPEGRWPANLIHDGSDEVLAEFAKAGEKSGKVGMSQHGSGTNAVYGQYARSVQSFINDGISDTGSAARFFYCAKASRKERSCNGKVKNTHPTVKPLALMRYLVRLVTMPDTLILDPFMGTGTTGVACVQEGVRFVGIEKDPESFKIAEQRIEAAKGKNNVRQKMLFT